MKQLARLGLMGVSIAASGCLMLGTSVAWADSITNTGPGSRNVVFSKMTSNSNVTNNNRVTLTNNNYQTATTGSVVVSGSTSYHPITCGNMYQNDWDSWNPSVWQQNGRSFDDWWSGMMSHMGQYYWSGGNNDSMNGGDGWDSWNPSIWQQNCSSYGNWLSKFNAYMTRNCTYWRQNWQPSYHNVSYVRPAMYHKVSYAQPALQYNMPYGGHDYAHAPVYNVSSNCGCSYAPNSYGGNATSGAATNTNNTQAEVSITNNVPAAYSHPTYAVPSVSAISNTGPHSFNLISSGSSQNTEVTNTNDVTITNTNAQTAVSGSATVSGNTRGGNATTGNATNTNNAEFDVAIANN